MTIELNDFQSRLRVLLGLRGAELTDAELSQTAECYSRCRGKEQWDVREYALPTAVGAREYRVVRGNRTDDVYRSIERIRAAAVGTALNELEAEESSREAFRSAAR